MSLNVFASPLPVYSFGAMAVRPNIVTAFGQQTEQRANRSGRTYHVMPYTWAALTNAEYKRLYDFFVTQGGTTTSFLWRDPDPDAALPWFREGISFGPSINAQTLYNLPTGASEYAGDYPENDGNLVVTLDGAVVTATAQRDARTITLGANPGAGHVLLASYVFSRRVRIDAWSQFTRGDHGLFGGSLTFREVPA